MVGLSPCLFGNCLGNRSLKRNYIPDRPFDISSENVMLEIAFMLLITNSDTLAKEKLPRTYLCMELHKNNNYYRKVENMLMKWVPFA